MNRLMIAVLFTILSVFVPCSTVLADTANFQVELFNRIQDMGYEKAYVNISDDILTIKIDVNHLH